MTPVLRRSLWTGGMAAALIAAYALFGFFAVPALLRSNAREFVSEHYGRELTIGEVRFNPFTLILEIHNLSFPDADREPMLRFARLLVNFEVSSLWRRGASFAAIELDEPYARALVRPDGTINFADLGKPFPAKPEPPQPEGPARLFIERFQMKAGQVAFEDRTRTSPFRAQLRSITFELRDFSSVAGVGQGNAYSFHGQSAAGERLDWSGTFSLHPLASTGKFEVADLQATTLWSYLRESLPFVISGGKVAFNGDYDLTTPAGVLDLKANVARLTVADLGLRTASVTSDDILLASLTVEDTHVDLAKRQVTIGPVRLSGGEVNARRDAEGQINLRELAGQSRSDAQSRADAEVAAYWGPTPETGAPEEAARADAAPETRAKAAAWTLATPDVSIEGLKISIEDQQTTPAASFALAPLDLRVTGFSTAPGTQLEFSGDVSVNGSGNLKAQGKLTPDTGAATAHVELAAIDLRALQPYIAQSTRMTLLSGQLGCKLDVERAAGGALRVKGVTEVAKLRTIDNALRQDFLKWDLLRASGIDYRMEPGSLRIDSIVARAPYARVIIASDKTVNLSQVLSASPSSAGARATPAESKPEAAVETKGAAPAERTSKPFAMSIGAVRISEGSANFADYWIQPNYAVSLQGMSGAITGLSSNPSSRAKIDLDGKVDRYAPAHISGEVNLLSASLYSDVKMTFRGVDLTSVTPYSGRFAGYKIEKGKLSVDLSYHVENRQLTADQKFVIDQMQLGERVESPDAVNLPLRLAVALLKDRNGVIELGLPLSGSLDDPKFRLGPIIWKAIVGLITKAVTAPFALLGRLFGGGEEMNLVDFEPGEAALDPAGQEKLAGLLKALQERPQLQLDVPMSFSPDLDRPVLAQRLLDTKLKALAQQQASSKKKAQEPDDTALLDPATRFDLLAAQYRLDFGKDVPLPPTALAVDTTRGKKGAEPAFAEANAELESAIAAKLTIADSDLEELGKLRAHAIQDALLGSGEIDPARVFIISAKPQAAGAEKVRLEMSLK